MLLRLYATFAETLCTWCVGRESFYKSNVCVFSKNVFGGIYCRLNSCPWRCFRKLYIWLQVVSLAKGMVMRTVNRHYDDVIMDAIASKITSLTIVYLNVYSGADQSKHQSSASLVFVWGIHRGPVNSPHKWPVTRKMFPFNDVIMCPISHNPKCMVICITLYKSEQKCAHFCFESYMGAVNCGIYEIGL